MGSWPMVSRAAGGGDGISPSLVDLDAALRDTGVIAICEPNWPRAIAASRRPACSAAAIHHVCHERQMHLISSILWNGGIRTRLKLIDIAGTSHQHIRRICIVLPTYGSAHNAAAVPAFHQLDPVAEISGLENNFENMHRLAPISWLLFAAGYRLMCAAPLRSESAPPQKAAITSQCHNHR